MPNSSARLLVRLSRKAAGVRTKAIGAAKCSVVNMVCMCVPTWPAPKRAGGYRRRVLERWGHPSVQCSSSCNALGARHQGHALRDLGTLGPVWRRRSMPRWCEFVRNLIRLMSWLYGILVARMQEAGLQFQNRLARQTRHGRCTTSVGR
jgi:hypothetical protein